ncbi:unnamed protein product [Rhodiola kirilowii]
MQLMRRQPVQARPCEFCGETGHKTDACSTLVEDEQGDVNALDGFQNYNNRPLGRQYGQTANGQNWRNNNRAPREPAQQASYNNYNQYQQRGQNQNQAGPSQQGKSLEHIVKDLATSVHQFQAKTDGAIANLSKQMSQIATTVSELKNDPGRLPSQTIPNPRGNVNAVTLRSGKELKNSAREPASETTAPAIDISSTLTSEADTAVKSAMDAAVTLRPNVVHAAQNSKSDFPLPFPVQVTRPYREAMQKYIYKSTTCDFTIG